MSETQMILREIKQAQLNKPYVTPKTIGGYSDRGRTMSNMLKIKRIYKSRKGRKAVIEFWAELVTLEEETGLKVIVPSEPTTEMGAEKRCRQGEYSLGNIPIALINPREIDYDPNYMMYDLMKKNGK